MESCGTAIFDLDGTLHHTEKALVPAIQMAMEDLGFPPAAPEAINALYGEPLEVFSRELLGSVENFHRDFMQGIREHQKKTLPKSGALYPGTVRMLEEVRGMGLMVVICSNAGIDYIELVTRTLGISHHINGIVGRDGNASKTHRVAGILESSGASFGVMVGDRYHDIMAATENGIPSIGCLYGYGGKGELDSSDVLVENPLEIPKAVRYLMERTNREEERSIPVP